MSGLGNCHFTCESLIGPGLLAWHPPREQEGQFKASVETLHKEGPTLQHTVYPKAGDTRGQPLWSSHRSGGCQSNRISEGGRPPCQRIKRWVHEKGFKSRGGSLSRVNVGFHMPGQLNPQEVNNRGKVARESSSGGF